MKIGMEAGAYNPQFAGTIPQAPASAVAFSRISPSEIKPGSIQSLYLDGPAGRLEALLNEGNADALYAALVCHPHPLGGGTMHNKVVYHAAKTLSSFGWPVLRFNFRGTGLSEGKHHGKAEADDARAALDWLENRYGKPIVAAGFSFGAAMGLAASCGNPAVRGFAALGLPTHAEGRDYHYHFLANCSLPKLLLSGDRDQFAPAAQLRSVADLAASPTQLTFILDADHFFSGQLEAMQKALGQWLKSAFPQGPGTEVRP